MGYMKLFWMELTGGKVTPAAIREALRGLFYCALFIAGGLLCVAAYVWAVYASWTHYGEPLARWFASTYSTQRAQELGFIAAAPLAACICIMWPITLVRLLPRIWKAGVRAHRAAAVSN